MNYVIDFLINAIALGMTFLYGSTGEIITEKVGHLNLGIPGIMCVGAAGGCAMVQALVLAGNVPGFFIVVLGILAAFFVVMNIILFRSFIFRKKNKTPA